MLATVIISCLCRRLFDHAVCWAQQAANLLCEHVATRNNLTLPVVRLASPAELEDVFRKVLAPLNPSTQADAACRFTNYCRAVVQGVESTHLR